MHHLTNHRNIMELKGAYKDHHSANLIMELYGIGKLFHWIIAKGHYSEHAIPPDHDGGPRLPHHGSDAQGSQARQLHVPQQGRQLAA
ncbi:hypothetical protein GYH30_022407 [Glycine max]|nr:hypothetical protein GYH30_022407 [Glycine max]